MTALSAYRAHRWITESDGARCFVCSITEDEFETADGPMPTCVSPLDLQETVNAYVECALWSSTNEDGIPLDSAPYDIADEARARMTEDVLEFLRASWPDLVGMELSQIGHDFWLTRNHHGAGFWDRGLGARGDSLTTAAQAYGSCDLYISDAGEVEVM